LNRRIRSQKGGPQKLPRRSLPATGVHPEGARNPGEEKQKGLREQEPGPQIGRPGNKKARPVNRQKVKGTPANLPQDPKSNRPRESPPPFGLAKPCSDMEKKS